VARVALITDVAWDDLHRERAILAAAGIDTIDGREASDAELARLAEASDAILTCWRTVDASMLRRAERCVTVSRYGVGLDNIDIGAATELGMVVTNVPDYCAEEVSDHVLALLLAQARRIPDYRDQTRAGGWDRTAIGPLRRLSTQTIGLIGYGRIGRLVGEKAAAFQMRVVANAPSRPAGTREGVVEFVSLTDLLACADYVSLHAPLSATTRHLLGARELAAMRPGAYLINTARGGLVDTGALVAALESGRLAGAGLDVVEGEPPPAGDALRRMEGVTLTPHVAFDSVDAVEAVATRAAGHAVAVLAGVVPETIVNPEVLRRANLRLPAGPTRAAP
jgi:D-3-phosphoglycerate dehydrogenase / 2-oxoglutarate reductase